LVPNRRYGKQFGDNSRANPYGHPMPDPEASVPDLATNRLRLRPLTLQDAPAAHQAFGDPTTMTFWDAPHSIDVAETERRIRQWHIGDPASRTAWAVLTRTDDRFIGMVNYYARLPMFRRLAVGWILLPGFQGQGYMQEAAGALLAHCFGQLDTHRIEAEIHQGNTRSARLAERLGFQREALLQDRLFVAGRPRSTYMYALLRPAWTG
jgi:RimJ/RimL family protein N-acetyltransferase